MPARIAALLHTVRILLGFGRHLTETAKDRSASPDFNPIAACFGTGRLHTILAHLQRGLLRAAALERVLLERAAQGRDIRFTEPRGHATATPAAPPDPPRDAPVEQPATPGDPPGETLVEQLAGQSADPSAEQPAEMPIARKARRSRPFGWNDPELFMPTLEEFVAQVRRRSLGRTLVDICLDLAVVPGFCSGPFWNTLFDSIDLLGGSVAALMQEKARRQEAFCEEQDKKPGSNWDWLEMKRDALRRVLGFCIGEVTSDSFDPIPELYAPAAAVAPGPS
jgi:hypothetical protein